MDLLQPLLIPERIVCTAALLAAVFASGCAGGIVSHRNGFEPNCAAEVIEEGEWEGELRVRRGIPVAIWPGAKVPRCFSREGRAEISEDFREMLQPEPPAPLKPPHSRFHPLPTQPVFAQRAEYHQPELLGVDPSLAPKELDNGPFSEEIPIPVPEAAPPEPGWRSLPAPRPNPPAAMPPSAPQLPQPQLEEPRPQARPIEMEPPKLQPDASRGTVAPASFTFTTEANSLRPAASTSARKLR